MAHAAIDATRLGVKSLLTETLLFAMSRDYLARVHPDHDWFTSVLAALTDDEHSTALLKAVPSADRRSVLGYTVCNYLQLYAARRHRTETVDQACWQALIKDVTHIDDLGRLGDAATNRMLLCQAETIYRRLASVGPGHRDGCLAELYLLQDRASDLRHSDKPVPLTRELTIAIERDIENGALDHTIDGLQTRVEHGDAAATRQLAQLLDGCAEKGVLGIVRLRNGSSRHRDTLWRRAVVGDEAARRQLSVVLPPSLGYVDRTQTVLAEFATVDQAAENGLDRLRNMADRGSDIAAAKLVETLVVNEELDLLRSEVDAGTFRAASRYLDCLASTETTEKRVIVDLRKYGLLPDGSTAHKWW